MTIANNQPQTIIRKKAGHEVPKEFLESALRKCPTVAGFAIRDVTNGVTSLEVDRVDHAIPVEDLLKINSAAKEYEVQIHLANVTGKVVKEDVQPFTFAVRETEEAEPIVLVSFCIEGDFPKYAISDSGHTDEYNFVQDIVLPMLEDLALAAEGDIGKFTASLHKPLFEKQLMAHVGHRAVFVFLPLEGDPICFGQNELGDEYDWGQVSQKHGWGKEPEKETNPIIKAASNVAKKYNIFGKKEAENPPGVHNISDLKKDIDIPKTDTALRTKVEIGPPSKLMGDARNAWLRLFNDGELPKNHQDKSVKVWVLPEHVPLAKRQDLSSKADVKSLERELKGIKLPANPIDMKTAYKAIEDATPKANVNDRGARPASDFIPDMTDKEMTEQTTILASFVDREKVPSALEIQKMEAKWPTYSEKMGIPFEDLLHYLVADIMAITGGHKPATMIILELRRRLIEKMDVKDLIGTAKHVAAKEILKPGETKKVGATTFKAAPTATEKRNFLFGKKAN